jgi:hypothetical protein
MKPVRAGQGLRHERFGFGVALDSNAERTTIDFHEHGRKTFVTAMLVAELVDQVPPKAPKPKAPRAPRRRNG